MAEVTRGQGESIERLISRLRRLVIRKGVVKQQRENMFFHRKPNKRQTREKASYREQKRSEHQKGIY